MLRDLAMPGAKGFGSMRQVASFTSPEMRQNGLCAIPPIAFVGNDSIPPMAFRGRPRRYTHIQRRSRERTGGYGSRRQEALPGSTRKTFQEMPCRRPFRLPQYPHMVRVILD